VRWPGKIRSGEVSNEIVQHHDWLPTFLAMAGDANIVEKLKKGYIILRTPSHHGAWPYSAGARKLIADGASTVSRGMDIAGGLSPQA